LKLNNNQKKELAKAEKGTKARNEAQISGNKKSLCLLNREIAITYYKIGKIATGFIKCWLT